MVCEYIQTYSLALLSWLSTWSDLDGAFMDDGLATSVRARIVSLGQLACGVLIRHDGSGLEDYLQDLRCLVLLDCPMRHYCNAMVM